MRNLMFIFGMTLVLASCSQQPAQTEAVCCDSTAVVVDTLAPVVTDTSVVDTAK